MQGVHYRLLPSDLGAMFEWRKPADADVAMDECFSMDQHVVAVDLRYLE